MGATKLQSGGAMLLVIMVSWHQLARAGSAFDNWGADTLVNLPSGRARLTVPVQAGDEGAPEPIDVPCACSDADPRDGINQATGTSCFYQRVFGNCNQDFMFDTNAELLPEGSCQMSCDRCSCCTAAHQVIQQAGGNKFLELVDQAQPGMRDILTNPGFEGVFLIPSDQAVTDAMAKYSSILSNPGILQQVVKFHIIPPEPVVKGLWTTPLLSRGAVLYTMYDGAETLQVAPFDMPAGTTYRGGLTGFTIQGPFNEATVTRSDLMGCKTYINMIDTLLLPMDPAVNGNSVAAIVGADGCIVQANSVIKGDLLVDGNSNIQATIGDCCRSCESAGGCNAWVYCSHEGGCEVPSGDVIPFGACTLKTSQEVAQGNAPWYDDVNAVTVPFVSGHTGGARVPAVTASSG